jgi:hypothetical protein
MPENEKNGWTRPGPIDAEEARKGTAAANPVLVVAAEGDLAGVPTGNGRGTHPGAAVDKAVATETDKAAPPRDTRSPAEIEADLDRTREHLSETLDELSERLSPRDLARRGGRRIKARFVDEQSGRPRLGPAATALGGLGGALAALAVLRRARNRRS